MKLTCLRCGHEWEQRKQGSLPVRCPKCDSKVWNKPRVKKETQ